ncbi:MAG: hypothetical protein JWR75_1961 [Devosia sp.]|nr:hypothetical protein [Devosia sp.]
MSHPIVQLQGALVAALLGDADLMALTGAGGVFDAPPERREPPYVVIGRHDVLTHDGDAAVGFEHRILVHAWADRPSRKAAVLLAERVVAVALGLTVAGALVVTHVVHERTDTVVDAETGLARAAVGLRVFTEVGE